MDEVYDAIFGDDRLEPAQVVCETRDDGHIIVRFAGRRFAMTEMGVMRGQHWFRDSDRRNSGH